MNAHGKQRSFAISPIVASPIVASPIGALTIGALTIGALTFLVACNPPASDQHLQEQAAQATETAKQDSKEALAQARVAASNAERAVNDVAAGVTQGIHDDHRATGGTRIDLNAASQSELASLPGISSSKARQIMQHRPYASTRDLVKSGLLTQHQFDQVAPQVTAK